MDEIKQLKIYLVDNDFRVLEVRRLTIDWSNNLMALFGNFLLKIHEIFSLPTGEFLKPIWIDKDGDKITVSTVEEFNIAMTEMKSDIKKFYVKVKSAPSKEENIQVNHPNIYCDGCNTNIVGFRYKCIVCSNYDLCLACEQINLHADHPMLRIPNPFIFDKTDLCKSIYILSSCISSKMDASKFHSHQRRRHSYDASGDNKKKRKCGKHESGPETDESEEIRFKKHYHGKWKKMNKCAYSQLMNDFFNYWDSSQVQCEETPKSDPKKKSNDQAEDELPHVKYFKSVGNTLTALLDPLGINVDFEIRSKNDEQNKTKPSEDKTETPVPTPLSSQQKEVHFAPQETTNKESLEEKIDEITKNLANQKVNESAEDDGWVSFDELIKKTIGDENGATNPVGEFVKPMQLNKTIPTNSAPTQETQNYGFRENKIPSLSTSKMPSNASVPTNEFVGTTNLDKTASTASAPPQESQNLGFEEHTTPSLNTSQMPSNPVIRQALEKMLSMGFTNDGGWLTFLLEAKNGDIYQVLEVLAPHKKS